MAFMKDPSVLDRWDCHDFDGDPDYRLGNFVAGPSADCADSNGFFDYHWGTTFTRQPSYTAFGQPQCFASILSDDWMPPQGCDQTGDIETIVPIHEDLAGVSHLDFANTERPAPNIPPLLSDTLTESLSGSGMATVGQGPEYVVKLLDRPSKPDSACPQDFTQPTHLTNQTAQQIAESTTLYYHDPLYQQPLASETELSSMSVASFDFNPLAFPMAVNTTGWPYGALPVSAAHDDMDENMAHHSPLSELFEMPDETDDWAVLMQQDRLFTGAFEMASFDYPVVGTDYQTIGYQTTDSQTSDYQTQRCNPINQSNRPPYI
ncbi:hypothetical protein CSUB01_10491 [Colletotrichum sublineola]|uniref:Uncharacterized protein n=1 Tax=Colletotrichum sublineola TaxID=1173701 RepID=A0A066XE74_COLSU|nr:hypothetical protein CSUB01_10491 [Colletotrichum sublineola]